MKVGDWVRVIGGKVAIGNNAKIIGIGSGMLRLKLARPLVDNGRRVYNVSVDRSHVAPVLVEILANRA